jgi:peptide/nickel transport system substrate-binding protein
VTGRRGLSNGRGHQVVDGILQRLTDRLPAWAQGRVRRRVLAGAVLAVVVVVLAVSCGGAGGTTDVPVLADGPEAGVQGVRSASDQAGGTLQVVAGDIDSLDPQRSYLPGVWNLMRLYTRTLVTFSPKPGQTGGLVPDLATDVGSSPDGGTTWKFTLRTGGTFENGRPITSKDVKYGIERSFASDVVVGGPTYVVDLLDDPANPYPGPYQDEAKDKLGLKNIETPDDKTIVFHLRRSQPDFPYVLALPSSSPVPVEADTGAKYGEHPVSSGPYLISSIDAQTGIHLTRNPKWSRASDPVRTALPDDVVVRTGLTGLERDQALLAGSADVDISGTGVQAATTARLADGSQTATALHNRVDDVTTGAVRLLALPTDVAPMDNAHCRAAVADVVDRQEVQRLLGGADDAVPSSQLWPRGVPGGPAQTDPKPDAAGARKELGACGQPQGFHTVLAVANTPATVDLAKGLARELAAVGITADVKPLDASTFYAKDIGSPDNVKASGYGIVLTTWTADFPSPGSFLAPLADGRGIRSVGNTDYARLNDPGINGLIDAARKTSGEGPGQAAWRKVAAEVLKTDVYVPLAETRVQLVAGERLHNGLVMQPYSSYDLATAGLR